MHKTKYPTSQTASLGSVKDIQHITNKFRQNGKPSTLIVILGKHLQHIPRDIVYDEYIFMYKAKFIQL